MLQGCAEDFGPSTPANVELKAGMDATQDLKVDSGFVKTAEPPCIADPIPEPPTRYTGDQISIDLKGDLTDFFKSIATISGIEVQVDSCL
jgi:hypothetical protein